MLPDRALGVKNERTLRRYLATLREAGFEISRSRRRYEVRGSPVRLAFTYHEALATLNIVESLAERDPVYGEHLASASLKLREALPKETLRFAYSGRVEFDLSFANEPPENEEILDTLRLATHRNQRVEIYYYSSSREAGARERSSPCAHSSTSVNMGPLVNRKAAGRVHERPKVDLSEGLDYARALYELILNWYRNADLKAQVLLTLDGVFWPFS